MIENGFCDIVTNNLIRLDRIAHAQGNAISKIMRSNKRMFDKHNLCITLLGAGLIVAGFELKKLHEEINALKESKKGDNEMA